jgi:methionyl-tRNA formyltransferase
LEKQQIEFGILAWWPYILKGKILNILKKGWLNFHPSFLPFNRGKNPNFWCLVDETICGVSLHFIDEGIDSGNIVAQKKFKTSWEDTGKTIYEKSRDSIVELFKETFLRLKNNQLIINKQNLNEGTFHKSSELDQISEIKLEENYKARKLLNILRARTFLPYPSAFFYDNGKKYSIKITIVEEQ